MPWIVDLLLRIATTIAALIWSAAIAPALPRHEIQIEARKFAFEPAVIMVTAGEPVRLVIHSRDATHGFSIEELSFHLEIPRSSEAVTAEFTAPPPGRYRDRVLRVLRQRSSPHESNSRQRRRWTFQPLNNT